MHLRGLCWSILLAIAPIGFAKSFAIKQITIQGLERLSSDTVFSYLPIKAGDLFDTNNSQKVIDVLYQTGLFSNIKINWNNNNLNLDLKEYPIIAEINIKGTRDLKEKNIREVMNNMGLALGRAINPNMIAELTFQLNQQYQARSKYSAIVSITSKTLSKGRIALMVDISEGRSARIREINFVGNKVYSDDRLKGLLDTTTANAFGYISKNDQFNPQRMAQDIKRIEDYYQNHGFFNFKVISNKLELSNNRENIYWTISVDEGKVYQNSGFEIIGDALIDKNKLNRLVNIKPDTIYKKNNINQSIQALRNRFADEGYAFVQVNVEPKVDELTNKIFWRFTIDPKQKVYVRHINFDGNKKTLEQVLRRELRQEESSLYSESDIQRGEERLRRLPQVDPYNLDRKIIPVAGKNNQVDIIYSITERSTRSISGSLGYGNGVGFSFGAGFSDDNFLGSGNRLSLNFNRNRTTTSYDFSYTNPYFTVDGISSSYQFSYQKNNFVVRNWSSDVLNGIVNFGYPISEYQKVYFGAGYRGTKIKTGDLAASEIKNFVENGNQQFHEGVISFTWSSNTTNDIYLPSSGRLNQFDIEYARGNKVNYFKSGFKYRGYFSTDSNQLTLGLRGNINYGYSFLGDGELPFYRRYFAGGIGSVRGYSSASLGPVYENGSNTGGSFRVLAGIDLFTPIGTIGRAPKMRVGGFIDAGMLYRKASDFSFSNNFRASVGVGVQWISPVGPLSINYAFPLNAKKGDTLDRFQIGFGANF